MTKLSPTELPKNILKTIDKLEIADGINLMIEDQYIAIKVIEKQKRKIEEIINVMYKHLKKIKSSRIIYCGAGTSGRIAVQDGVELFPTFGWPKNRFKFILAGGDKALISSIENSEDDKKMAIHFFKKLKICKKDIVIGLAASGNTPFTCQIMDEAVNQKALTIALSNNPYGKILKKCDYSIILDTKEEVITGSTRLKAGTSQKICLNLISTILMTRLGFVKNGLMINLIPSNSKLRKRRSSILNSLKKSDKNII